MMATGEACAFSVAPRALVSRTRWFAAVLIASVPVALAACSGGGGSGTVDTRFTVSAAGVLFETLQLDGDINDPTAPLIANNSLSSPQTLTRLDTEADVVVAGYVTQEPTGGLGGRFDTFSDALDVYRVTASRGDVITLSFAAEVPPAPENAAIDPLEPQADLDLLVFDASGRLLALSNSADDPREMVVLQDNPGEILIEVEAFSGASNYVLTITRTLTTPAVYAQIDVDMMAAQELSVEREPTTLLGRKMVSRHRLDRDASDIGSRAMRGAWLGQINALDQVADVRRQAGLAGRSRHGAPRESWGEAQAAAMDPSRGQKLALLDVVKALNAHEGADTFKIMHQPQIFQVAETDPLPDAGVQWNLFNVGWDEVDASGLLEPASSTLLAVLDAGFATEHPELADAIVDERDFISFGFPADAQHDARPDSPFDSSGRFCHTFHGTHVASSAMAPRGNGGMVGVVPDADLMAIKLGSNRSGCRGISFRWSDAVLYAAGLENISGVLPPRRADVINMSFGGPSSSLAEQAKVSQAADAGVILVSSAGNSGGTVLGQFPSYPAAYDDVVAVGSVNIANERAFYSSYYAQVDITAPGGETGADVNVDGLPDGIYAAIVEPNGDETAFDTSFDFYQGTSMASPHAAAGIALMKSIAPGLDHDAFMAFLSQGALSEDFGATSHDNEFGFGVMSLPKMANAATQFNISGPPPARTLLGFSPFELDFGADVSELIFSADRLGEGPLSVTGLSGDANFGTGSSGALRVEAVAVDAEGRGTYHAYLNRARLAEGETTGEVGFVLGDGDVSFLGVRAERAAATEPAVAVPMQVVLERREMDGTFTPVITEVFPAGLASMGGVSVLFEDVEAGVYRIVAGTDLDNDGELCDAGELCARHPDPFSGQATFEGRGDDPALLDLPLTLRLGQPSLTAQAPQ